MDQEIKQNLAIDLGMKKVLIISRYQYKKDELNFFHFKGYFKGEKIAQIAVNGGSFERGEDYALALTSVLVVDGILIGELKKSKKL